MEIASTLSDSPRIHVLVLRLDGEERIAER